MKLYFMKVGYFLIFIFAILNFLGLKQTEFEIRQLDSTARILTTHAEAIQAAQEQPTLNAAAAAALTRADTQICEQNDIVILAMECHIDHCHLFVNAPPTLSAAEIMKIIKGTTGRILKQEFFPDTVMQMWTRSYFVSTAGDVSNATIQRYVEEQKTRGG